MDKRQNVKVWWLGGILTLVTCVLPVFLQADDKESSRLALRLRSRQETDQATGRFHASVKAAQWDAGQVAVIVCDMWDLHHCLNATRRGAEMAPRMNALLKHMRSQGATIIHAPSSCMDSYTDHPARKRAQTAPRAANIPKDIGQWCYKIPAEENGKYPIDQSDGGEDDDLEEHQRWATKLKAMGRNPGAPWKAQTDLLEIRNEDYVSDNGEEIWSVLEMKGIARVMLVGVHTNMCVLGRPFGLRQMAKNGKQVVLVRDMTDTMYNPARAPYVSHFTGTDLIVEHIEKWVCPTITSDQILGGQPFQFKKDTRPHLVVVTAEREYETNRTLPKFCLEQLGKDFRVSHIFANAEERNDLPGIEVLKDADVLLLSVRRRVLPPSQMALIRDFVESGKPVVGIRTASHPFSLNGKEPPAGYLAWDSFDHDILGGHYSGHHGAGVAVSVKVSASGSGHPLLAGVQTDRLQGFGSLYKAGPLVSSATPLLIGSVPGKEPEPLAWTNTSKYGGRVFYTAMGHPDDFNQPAFNQLLKNGIYWAATMVSAD